MDGVDGLVLTNDALERYLRGLTTFEQDKSKSEKRNDWGSQSLSCLSSSRGANRPVGWPVEARNKRTKGRLINHASCTATATG